MRHAESRYPDRAPPRGPFDPLEPHDAPGRACIPELREWRERARVAQERRSQPEIARIALRDAHDVDRAHVEIGHALMDLARRAEAAEPGAPVTVTVRGIVFQVTT